MESTYYRPKRNRFLDLASNLSRLKRPGIISPRFPRFFKGFRKIFLGLFSLFLVLGVTLVIFVGYPLYGMYRDVQALQERLYSLKGAVKNQNLTQMEVGLSSLEEELTNFQLKFERRTKLIKHLPFVKGYYGDAQHMFLAANYSVELGDTVVGALKPFGKDLGLKVEGEDYEIREMTNQERIIKLLGILPNLNSEVDKIAEITRKIDEELSYVDETRYPKSFRNIKIRSSLISAKALAHELAEKSPHFRGLFKELPNLLGLEEPKVYMVFMANNYELRMSGGFNTYVILLKLDRGVPEILSSVDTYDIDRDKFFLVNRNVPYYLRDYLRVDRFYARDATSTSPDFVKGADTFLNAFWRKDRSLYQKIDGVIQINNFVVEDLLRVLGPVDAGGYSIRTDKGNYIGIPIKEFNSENVTYELERIAGGSLKEIIGRKDIIKYLASSIMQKVLNASTENVVPLVRVLLNSLASKDVMIYSFDEDTQNALEALGYSGRISDTPETWDYLHVNHSNFGAGKRDWLVKRYTEKKVYEENGRKVSEVKFTITNPKSPDWWEWFPFYNDYFRIYVPKGSRLISAVASDGQDLHPKEFEDLGKTFFEGFFKIPEGSSITITYKYTLPDTVDFNNYNLLIQKQPGTRGDIYVLEKGDYKAKFELTSDRTFNL